MATEKKFYVSRAHSDTNTIIHSLDLEAGVKVHEMRTYPDTNDLYVLNENKLEALVFRNTGTTEPHPNCSDEPTNLFDRACENCKTGRGKVTALSPKSPAVQICKISDVAAGQREDQRGATKDYYEYQGWPTGAVKLRCIGDDKKNSTTPVTPPTAASSIVPPDKKLTRLLGMPIGTLYLVVGILAGASIGLCVSIVYCVSKKSKAGTLTISRTSHNHHVFQRQFRAPRPNPHDISEMDRFHRGPDDYKNEGYSEESEVDFGDSEDASIDRQRERQLERRKRQLDNQLEVEEELENRRRVRAQLELDRRNPRKDRFDSGASFSTNGRDQFNSANSGNSRMVMGRVDRFGNLHPLDVESRNRVNYFGYH